MSGAKRILLILLLAGMTVLGAGGCSRSVINYQIAESIGTVGEYENNAPVETPKMQAEREEEEAEETLEAERVETLEAAEVLAESYWYEEAIALLEESQSLEGDERAEEAIAEYQEALDALVTYEDEVLHLNFPTLIADTDLAFDEDSYAETYRQG